MLKTIAGLLALVVLAVQAPAQTVSRIYWTEWSYYSPTSSRVARANADGTGIITLIDGLNSGAGVKDLVVDSQAGKLYIANPIDNCLERCNLDGTERETVVSDVNCRGLALDLNANRIYFADYAYNDPAICRAYLDGTGVEILHVASDGCDMQGICLDLPAGKLYWAERMDQQIWLCNLDFTGAGLILQCYEGIGHPWGLAVTSSRIYWTSDTNVFSALKDGSDIQVLVEGLGHDGRQLELDAEAGQLYVSTEGSVQRVNLDGTNLVTLVPGLYSCYGLGVEFGTPVAVPEAAAPVARLGNHPNPFNPATVISCELDRAAAVRLQVYALDGKLVSSVFAGQLEAGPHSWRWDGRDRLGRDLPSGVYVYRLEAGSQVLNRRMTLVR
jgi:hypothetical protein